MRTSASLIGLIVGLSACSSPDKSPLSNGSSGNEGNGAASAGGSAAGGASGASTGGSATAGGVSAASGGATASAGSSATSTGGNGTAGSVGASGNSAIGGGGGTTQGAAGSAGASGSTAGGLVYPPAAGTGDVAAGIDQLNRYRATLGLSMVTLDDASSTGCSGHLQYLIEEAQTLGQTGYLSHDETDMQNSHYSAANQTAGQESDLAFGQSGGRGTTTGQSLAQAVDLWINGLYHRHPLLAPGLVKVGAASMSGYNCLDYGATGNTTNLKAASAIVWPADGMSDVPRSFGGNEGPCPTNPTNPLAGGSCGSSGFIPSATFYNWGTFRTSAINSVASVTLTDVAAQTSVLLLAWYADKVTGHDPASGYMQDEISLVPMAMLNANTAYRVDISATVSNAPTTLSWTFTTGTRNQ